MDITNHLSDAASGSVPPAWRIIRPPVTRQTLRPRHQEREGDRGVDRSRLAREFDGRGAVAA